MRNRSGRKEELGETQDGRKEEWPEGPGKIDKGKGKYTVDEVLKR